jgi:hypothetical protein
MYAGLGLGMSADDFMIYKQKGNVDVRVLRYEPLVVPGLIVGPEIGIDWKDRAFLETAVDFGFANGATYYKIKWGATAGVSFHNNWYGFVGGEIINRETGVWLQPEGGGKKSQEGILSDHINAVSIGVGYQR